VGNNYAYQDWDFVTATAGPAFSPNAPLNDSPNNTGLSELPPAQPAMIWYPYAASEEFPELGKGGRSAMAGEFYTYQEHTGSPNRFPEFYDGTLFVMEWMRNWVMALRFDENENFLRAEPFMTTNGDFRRPIDLTFSKDGIMYMLEYGSVYGADNDDARLVKIEYNTGNRSPIAQAGIVDTVATAFRNKVSQLTSENRLNPMRHAAGQSPMKVQFTSRGSRDLDNDDAISYQWLFDGSSVGSEEKNPSYTFTEAGTYDVVLRVTDQSGLSDMDTIEVRVGNAPPEVLFATNDNKSFFWEGERFEYQVEVKDAEDGDINPRDVNVFFDYNPDIGNLPTEDTQGHREENLLTLGMPGNTLIASSDCKACHTVDQKSVGPSYNEVAQRYKEVPGAVGQLARKIINGGAGNWGTTNVMSAHPQVSTQDARKMVEYILSLAEPKEKVRELPLQGSIAFREHSKDDQNGRYLLMASYMDKGANGIAPLSGKELLSLRSARVKTAFADGHPGFTRWGNSLGGGNHKAHILLKNVDLSGIRGFTFEYGADKEGTIEVRIDSQEGQVIASTPYSSTVGSEGSARVSAKIASPVNGRHDVYFVVLRSQEPYDDIINLGYINVEK
jgi:cytochrome c